MDSDRPYVLIMDINPQWLTFALVFISLRTYAIWDKNRALLVVTFTLNFMPGAVSIVSVHTI